MTTAVCPRQATGPPRGWGRGPEAAWHLGTCGRSVSTAVPKPRGAEGERTAHTHRHGASGGWVPGRAGERGGNGAGPLGVIAPRPWLHAPLPTRRRPGRSDRASHAVRLALGRGGQADCVRSSWGAGPVSPSHSHRALPQAGSLTGNHSPCSEAGSRDPGRAGPSELRGSVRSRRPPPRRLCLSSHGVCIRVRSSHSHEDTGRPGSGACEDLVLADCPQGPTSKGGILRAAC